MATANIGLAARLLDDYVHFRQGFGDLELHRSNRHVSYLVPPGQLQDRAHARGWPVYS